MSKSKRPKQKTHKQDKQHGEVNSGNIFNFSTTFHFKEYNKESFR